MRIVVDRGKQPGSVMGYLLRTDKREKGQEDQNPVFHTNMFGENAQELTEELRFSADQNEQVERTYGQYKISFPPGENPDLQTKIGIVDDVLEMRGHGRNCQFFAVEHFEKIDKHDVHHLHVLWSTVRMDGTWVNDSYERVKLKDVERQIELKRDLQYCPPKEKGERVNTPIGEVKLKEQGQPLTKDTLRTALDEVLTDQPSMPLLMARIKAQGYTMQFHEFEDGKGVSFGAEGRYFKGRQLGDRFSFNGLHQYAGVDYQPERDDPMLRQLNGMNAEQCQAVLPQIEPPEQSRQPELEQQQKEQEHPPVSALEQAAITAEHESLRQLHEAIALNFAAHEQLISRQASQKIKRTDRFIPDPGLAETPIGEAEMEASLAGQVAQPGHQDLEEAKPQPEPDATESVEHATTKWAEETEKTESQPHAKRPQMEI